MKKKFSQNILNEEVKRFRLLTEYSFYTEEPKDDAELILGNGLEEENEDPNNPDLNQDPNQAPNPAGPEQPADDSKTAANNPDQMPPQGDAGAPPVDGAADTGADDFGGDIPANDAPLPEPDSNDVEIDITQLVKAGEETKATADMANRNTEELLNKFNDLERRVASMTNISSKIETLEKEIVKRNPTPLEKLEMRSKDSYPYNIKLTDYWSNVEGYQPFDDNAQQPKEYVLRQDDDNSFVDASVKDSFNVPEDYEEEDI